MRNLITHNSRRDDTRNQRIGNTGEEDKDHRAQNTKRKRVVDAKSSPALNDLFHVLHLSRAIKGIVTRSL
ncbi:hypothetical protein SDC9_157514 [bioreactor metagenome]|uniref:Uncharacterized protein n=1 Tax=bioreactor metagenome TaxID=1076179 RepID=A0A645FA69_9ZZZZ